MLNSDIINSITIKLFSEDLTEQKIFSNFLKLLSVNQNVFKFHYNEEVTLLELTELIKSKKYHTLVRMILTNNPNIVINIGSLAAKMQDLILMEMCECYVEINHKEMLDKFYINMFINLIRSPTMIYINYVKFFSQFEWYYEQYDIFLIEILLKNRPGLFMPEFMNHTDATILLSITIQYNLFDLFKIYFRHYFDKSKFYVKYVLDLCITFNNKKILKYVLKRIVIKNNYTGPTNTKVEKFLHGLKKK